MPNQQDLIPEYFGWGEIVGNHIDILEHAITHGLVVQNYPHSYVKDGNKLQKRIYKAYFANPTTYDLFNLPPHIFFDGTMLDPKFLGHKFLKVKHEPIDIKVKALWKLQVRQNINTDLTQNKIPENRKAVETYLRDLLNQLGPNHKYYIVSSKSIRNAYLNNFLSENFIEYSFFVTHYGNLRGINEAKECDVGIMVGSFIPSDAVEIAMALDFIQDRLPTKKILKTLGKNNVWKWAESNTVRIYNPGFEVVSDLSKSFRLFEHRQAIARSRYISHDVDFYVLSKAKIGDFESYAEVVDYQFRADLFSPRRREKDSKREQVETCANSILDKQDEVGESQIHEMRKISRTTIRKHLKAMVEEGALVKIRGKYHRNKNNNEKHHDLLF